MGAEWADRERPPAVGDDRRASEFGGMGQVFASYPDCRKGNLTIPDPEGYEEGRFDDRGLRRDVR